MRALIGIVLIKALLWQGVQAACSQLCDCTTDSTCDGGCVPYAYHKDGIMTKCECLDGYSAYQNVSKSYCIKCDSTCSKCFGPNINNCASCPDGFTFNSSESTCYPPNNETVITIESSYKFLGFQRLSNWLPTSVTSTVCDIYSLLGGYNKLTASMTVYSDYTLPAHYETRVLAALFWITSGVPDPTFQIIVEVTDNTASTSVNTPTPLPSSASNGTCSTGQKYWGQNIDTTLPSKGTSTRISFYTDGSDTTGQYWGIREFVLIINLCHDATCKTCSGPDWNQCDSCIEPERSRNVAGYTSECRCYGTSSVGTFFRHPDHTIDACVDPCPNYPNQYYGDPITRDCVLNCPTTAPGTGGWNMYFADDNFNECRDHCSTPLSTSTDPVYHDRTNQKCVTKCPSTEPYSYAANMTCYSTCPNSEFKNNRDFTCVPTCPNTPDPPLFGYSGECLQVCPTGTYADPYTQQCSATCTWITGHQYFFDNSTGYRKCVLVCPAPTYFGDTHTKTCVDTCQNTASIKQYGDVNSATRYCVGTCTGGYFGLTTGTRICVNDCPNGTWASTVNYTCVVTALQCGTQYADNNTRQCVAGGTCSIGMFSHNSTKTCVVYCPSGEYADTGTGYCEPGCSGLYFADQWINACVTTCFKEETYADVGSGNKCVTQCNYSDLYPFADNSTKKCVDLCPASQSYFADSILHQCVLNCSAGTYAYDATSNHTCVTSCPSPYYADNSTGTGLCVRTCPAQPPLFGDTVGSDRVCVVTCGVGTFGDQTRYRECMTPCPTPYYAQDDSTRLCVLRCKANTYGLNNYCWTAMTCPTGFGDDTTNLCVSPCPYQNATFGDPNTKKCVSTCPIITSGSTTTIFYADESIRECVSTCNATTPSYGNNNTQVCVTHCVDANAYADAQSSNRFCIDVCTWTSSVYYRNTFTKQCVLPSNCPTNYYADNDTLNCVYSCPIVNSNQTWGHSASHTCVRECYGSVWGDASTGIALCVGTCPSVPPKWSYDGNMTCMSVCPTSPALYGEDFNRTCVSLCPFPPTSAYKTYSYEPTRVCLKTCPDLYYGDDTATVMKCWNDPFLCTYGWGDPHTHLCTSLCTGPLPIDSYGDNATNLCTTFCTTGTFADNYTSTRTCVSPCPSAFNSFGDPSTHTCVLHCVTPNTWADSATRLCEPVCTHTTYAQDLTYTCVVAMSCPTVPAYLFGDNNTWSCVESCKYTSTVIEWADNTTRTCVPQCPNYTNQRYYGDTSTGVPICVIICPISPVLFGYNSTNRCVSECLDGLYGDQTGNRSCLALCPVISGVVWFSQINHHICVTVCENLTYGSYHSSHCQTTPFDCIPGQFGDDSTHLCVPLCPESMNFFGNPSTKLCVNRCPNVTTAVVNASAGINEPVGIRYSDYSTRLCVQTCPSSYGLHGTFGDNMTNNCVELCPLGTFGDSQTIHRVCVLECSQISEVSFADSSTRRCVAQCPSSPPLFGQTTTFTCVATCTGTTYASAVNRQCMSTCPAGQFKTTSPINLCVDVCPSNPDTYGDSTSGFCETTCTATTYANSVTRLCVGNCSPMFQYNGRCVQYCPDGYYANSSNNCVTPANCGASKYAQNSTTTCQSTCQQGYADPASHYCIAVCPTGWYGDVNVCTQTCNSALTSASSVTNLCVADCPPFTYSNGSTCVSVCTTGYADDSTHTCAGTCPAGATPPTYAQSSPNKCVAVCNAGQFRDASQTCKAICNPKFGDNVTLNCEVACSDGSWGNRNTWLCDASCPTGTYGYLVDRKCYTPAEMQAMGINNLFGDPLSKTFTHPCQTSPNLYFGDPVTGTCVTTCPNVTSGSTTTIYYADPSTRKCETACQNAAYSADPSNNLCSIQCSYGYFTQNGSTPGTSGLCVTQCLVGYADSSTRICVATCPQLVGTFGFYNTSNSDRICMQTCPLNWLSYPFDRTCVTYCPTPYFAYSPTRSCVVFCNNTFADPSTRVCASTCTSATYPNADNSTNQCVFLCPTQPDYYASNHVCVYDCPTGQFADPSLRVCTTLCPSVDVGGTMTKTYGDPNTKRCEFVCTNGLYGDNSTMMCKATCPTGSYADDYTGKCASECPGVVPTYADAGTNKCTRVCSRATQFADNITSYSCRVTCNSPQFGDPLSKLCVPVCPAFGYLYGSVPLGRKCVTSCAGTSEFADNFTRECVGVCTNNTVPQGYADSSTSTCVVYCPNGTFAQNTTLVCRSDCISVTGFADNTSGYCVARCFNFPQKFADTTDKTCVSKCRTGQFSDNNTNYCVGLTGCSRTPDTYSDVTTGQCVLFCSQGFYAQTTNYSCTSYCINGFADNLTRRCVATCPGLGTQDTFADTDSHKCVRVCPSGTWAQNSSKTCVPTCPPNEYADDISRYCVGQCPTNPLTFGHNSVCVPTCPTIYYGSFETHTCVTTCVPVVSTGVDYYADPISKTCVTVCPIGSSLYADTTQMTCVGTCTAGEFRNPANQTCVGTCPSDPDLYADNLATSLTYGSCVRICPAYTYAENTSRVCQTSCSGFAGSPYKDDSVNRCVAKCPSKPFLFADNTSWSCVSGCPMTSFADNKTQSCVSTCPSAWNLFADTTTSTCVTTCPSGSFAVNSTSRCESSCTSSYADNFTNICLQNCTTQPHYYADSQNWVCVFTCPANAYKYDVNQSCVVTVSGVTGCPTTYYGDPTKLLCVEFCPLGYFALNSTKKCETKCTGTLYADNTTRMCVSICPANYYGYLGATENTCVQVCPTGTFAEGAVCSATCSVLFAYNLTFTCQANCPIPYFADSSTHLCSLICSTGFASSISRTCVPVCPPSTFGDNSTKSCVIVCPNNSYADPAPLWMCVSLCSPGTFADPSTLTCVSSCPAQPSLWADPTTSKCVPLCPSPNYFNYDVTRTCTLGCPNDTSSGTVVYFADSSTQKCVLNCPANLQTFADSATNLCTSLCTSGNFASQLTKQCVSLCPNIPVPTFAYNSTRLCLETCLVGSYADPTSRICLATCPTGTWGDPTTHKCVTFCPNNYYAYNGTNVCLYLTCNIVSNLFADNTTHTCVSICPASANLYGDPTSGTCVKNCPSNYYSDTNTQKCVLRCDSATKLYAYSLTNECLQACPAPYIAFDLDHMCILSCPDTYFKNITSNACSKCPNECTNCLSYTECTGCISGYKLFSGVCNSSCVRTNPLTYANSFTDSCVIAMLCPSGYFGDNSSLVCTQNCPTKTYGESTTKTCENCPQTCATCTSLSTCQSCEGAAVLASDGMCYSQCNGTHPYTYNGNCYLLCPTGTYLTANNVICASCASMCLTCTGLSTNCTSCLGMYNYNGECLSVCPNGYYGETNYTCQPCAQSTKNQCTQPLNFSTTINVQNYQYVMYLKFNQNVTISKNLSDIMDVKLILSRRLVASIADYVNNGIPFIYEILADGTIKIYLSVDMTLVSPKFVVVITDPNAITSKANGGTLQRTIDNIALSSLDYYPPSVGSQAGTNTLSLFMTVVVLIFMFLGWLFVPLSILPILHTFQLIYFHIYIDFIMPANFYYYLKGFYLSTLSFLPNILAKGLPNNYWNINVPQRIIDLHGDFNFSRNAGSILFVVIVYGIIAACVSFGASRVIPNKIWRNMFKGVFNQRFVFCSLHQIGFMFFLNVLFFSFLQFKDYSAPNTFEGFNLFMSLVFMFSCLIFPFFVFYKLIKNRHELETIQENYEFSYHYQKPQGASLYFTIFYYIRGMLFVIFLAGLFSSPLGQLISLMILNTAMLVGLLAIRPYKQPITNVFHIIFQLTLLFIESLLLYCYYNSSTTVSNKLNYGTIGIITTGLLITAFVFWAVFRWAIAIRGWWEMVKKTEFYKEYADEDYQGSIEEDFIEVEKKVKNQNTAVESDIIIEKIYKELKEDGTLALKIRKKKKKLKQKKKKRVQGAQLFQELADQQPMVKKDTPYVRINPQNIFDLKANNTPAPQINQHFEQPEPLQDKHNSSQNSQRRRPDIDDDDRPASVYSSDQQPPRHFEHNSSVEVKKEDLISESQREEVQESSEQVESVRHQPLVSEQVISQQPSNSPREVPELPPKKLFESPKQSPRQQLPYERKKNSLNIITFDEELQGLQVLEASPAPQIQPPKPLIAQTKNIGHFFDDLLSEQPESEQKPKNQLFDMLDNNDDNEHREKDNKDNKDNKEKKPQGLFHQGLEQQLQEQQEASNKNKTRFLFDM